MTQSVAVGGGKHHAAPKLIIIRSAVRNRKTMVKQNQGISARKSDKKMRRLARILIEAMLQPAALTAETVI
jgi:hypothetical protein